MKARSAVLASALVLTGSLAVPVPASAELMLYPTRVVIGSRQRSAQVEMINRGSKAETYRISVVNRRMTETGEIVVADARRDADFADSMIRYTPRQVTLQPGATQTIRISVRKPADLPEGEYRSHLQFDPVPDPEDATNLEAAATAAAAPGEFALVIQALIGASIPVIVRHGTTQANVSLDSIELEPGGGGAPPMLRFTFRRDGNRSVYGNVVATYEAPGRKPVEVARVDGIAVYAANAVRKARLPLRLPEGVALRGGTIGLRYAEPRNAGGRLLAEARIAVP